MNQISQKIRTVGIVVVFSAVFLFFGLRLIKLQVVEHDHYVQLANLQTPVTQTVPAARGEIVDRYGRPLVTNRTGFGVVFDRSFLPKGRENEIILRLSGIMTEAGEVWIDTLPMQTTEPLHFLPDRENDVSRLKKFLNLESYATADDVWHWLQERYALTEGGYTLQQQRLIAGVRYEMEQRGFSRRTRYTFAEDIKVSTMARIKEASFDLPGVDVQESAIRDYLTGDIAPHIIGRLGPIYQDELDIYNKDKGYSANDIVGKEGIEKAFEEQLRGHSGTREITYQNGEVLSVVETETPQPGNTVVLSIDRELQKVTQLALENRIKQLQVERKPGFGRESNAGAAVAIEIKTGDVLAAATYPSYNLNTYGADYSANVTNELLPLYNRAVLGGYAPGSIYKPMVASAALNESVIERSSTVFCNHTYLFYAPSYTPSCMYFHGTIDTARALAVSCNVFFYDVGRRLGIEKMEEYARAFGLGEPTGIELPEMKGQVGSPALREKQGGEWYPADVIQAAIGQGDNMFSPLQLANYAATLARGGQRLKLNMVKSIVSYNFEETIQQTEPQLLGDAHLSSEAVSVVQQGMNDAARQSYGTGYSIFGNYPVNVACKTGTPETGTDLNATFIAYAPAEDPEIAIFIVIEKGYNGYLCGPVAKAVFDQYFFANKDAQSPAAAQTLLP